ncbi:AMP deaminase [Besnoitia besnoiti]|uniref:AMP deaminase n=1 Tax=Besnoitia besnoiti TaxID=94643 RepID=A0A2A9MJQ3_BESBE|nr:AMP deaminase [Besnoitia besnoiti]PFH35827.1 AMP deaminase [Besnoitia besnoiti]
MPLPEESDEHFAAVSAAPSLVSPSEAAACDKGLDASPGGKSEERETQASLSQPSSAPPGPAGEKRSCSVAKKSYQITIGGMEPIAPSASPSPSSSSSSPSPSESLSASFSALQFPKLFGGGEAGTGASRKLAQEEDERGGKTPKKDKVLATPGDAGDQADDEQTVGWSYMFKKLLSLNHKDAGAVTYLEKLPTVPAKAGSAAAAAGAPPRPSQSSGPQPRRRSSSGVSAGSVPFSAGQAGPTAPGTTPGVGYVRMVPSKDLAVASSVCDESVEAVRLLAHTLQLRQQWWREYREVPAATVRDLSAEEKAKHRSHEPIYDPFSVPLKPPCHARFHMHHGVYRVFWDPENDVEFPENEQPPLLCSADPIPDVLQFLCALKDVMTAVQHPACKTFCYKRLRYLEEKFSLHLMFNSPAEVTETKCNYHRDFYNVRKVDTHIHHSACMQQKHLLRFIRKKYRTEPDTVVAKTRDGREQTLAEVFHSEVGIGAHDASIDHLNVHALGSCFQRFDLFNQKYNPFGQKTLRDIFLKTDNYIEGRFLAEITREVISDLEERRYQHVEWRLSIYGRSRDEWAKLAKWVVGNGLHSKRVRWMVQVPRLYHVYRRLGMIKNFGELLANVFEPLFEAVRNPKENPELFIFLHMLVGWDSVDDESYASKYTMEGGELPKPEKWTGENNPPYSYWGYYMYANIRALNQFIEARGMRALAFRPHCGEAGSVSHLATMFLLSDAINHGIMLKKCPVLQYLFYLSQIGLAVSPLSNNALFMDIAKNPLYSFFKIGMNVSISTDDPLMFHFTDEPLLEEYSVAAHTWKLSPVDLCELARNSVVQSGYEEEFKRHWLGPNYKLGGRRGNCMRQTNVSSIRLQYREDALREELSYMHDVLALRIALSRPLTPSLHAVPVPATALPPLPGASLPPPASPSGQATGAAGESPAAKVVAAGKRRERDVLDATDAGLVAAAKHPEEAIEGGGATPSRSCLAANDDSLSLFVSPLKKEPDEVAPQKSEEETSSSSPPAVGPGDALPESASSPPSPAPSQAEREEQEAEDKKVPAAARSDAEEKREVQSGGASPPQPLMGRREAAMKKLLEVAEESLEMDLGEIPGNGVSSPMPRSESFEVLDGPSREALQTLDACSHLERREDASVDRDMLKKLTSSQPNSRSPFLSSSFAPGGVAVLAGGGAVASLPTPALRRASSRRAANMGLLDLLASPFLHEHLSHADRVIVGEYANSTAEGGAGGEEGDAAALEETDAEAAADRGRGCAPNRGAGAVLHEGDDEGDEASSAHPSDDGRLE